SKEKYKSVVITNGRASSLYQMIKIALFHYHYVQGRSPDKAA
ncbi:26809_t:CDS:1, partial [Racocetra persica]